MHTYAVVTMQRKTMLLQYGAKKTYTVFGVVSSVQASTCIYNFYQAENNTVLIKKNN